MRENREDKNQDTEGTEQLQRDNIDSDSNSRAKRKREQRRGRKQERKGWRISTSVPVLPNMLWTRNSFPLSHHLLKFG